MKKIEINKRVSFTEKTYSIAVDGLSENATADEKSTYLSERVNNALELYDLIPAKVRTRLQFCFIANEVMGAEIADAVADMLNNIAIDMLKAKGNEEK